MGKKVCVYQPGYFQPLHYFARIYESDIFVSLAGAQLVRKHDQHRAKLNGLDLTVPVGGGHRQSLTDAVPCYEQKWVDKHLTSLKHAYGKAPFYADTMAIIEPMLRCAEQEKWSLARLGIETVGTVMDLVGWGGEVFEVPERPDNIDASDWMLDIVMGCGGDTYICGKPAFDNYLRVKDFEDRRISVEVQEWKCPVYKQKGAEFKANLSILDALMHCNEDEFISVLRGVQE